MWHSCVASAFATPSNPMITSSACSKKKRTIFVASSLSSLACDPNCALFFFFGCAIAFRSAVRACGPSSNCLPSGNRKVDNLVRSGGRAGSMPNVSSKKRILFDACHLSHSPSLQGLSLAFSNAVLAKSSRAACPRTSAVSSPRFFAWTYQSIEAHTAFRGGLSRSVEMA